jgi:hypothetical protein
MPVRAKRHPFAEKRLGKVRLAADKVELSMSRQTCFVTPKIDFTSSLSERLLPAPPLFEFSDPANSAVVCPI